MVIEKTPEEYEEVHNAVSVLQGFTLKNSKNDNNKSQSNDNCHAYKTSGILQMYVYLYEHKQRVINEPPK